MDKKQERRNIIDKVIKKVEKEFPAEKSARIAEFLSQYYTTASYDDLVSRSTMDLYGAVLSMWNFMHERQPGTTKVRVYNPHFEQHGWQSTHTIVEIITDDMPFIVDSTLMEIERHELAMHFVIHVGGVKIKRDKAGKLLDIIPFEDDSREFGPCGELLGGKGGGAEGKGAKSGKAAGLPKEKQSNILLEAPVYIEIDRQTDPEVLQALHDDLVRVLGNVRQAVRDWALMKQNMGHIIDALVSKKTVPNEEERDETVAFLKWVADDHFTFLGYRHYELTGKGDKLALQIVEGESLGLLRETSETKGYKNLAKLTPEARKLLLSDQILIIQKTNIRSTVHRPTYSDYISVKCFDDKGNIQGEHRFLGLYTSTAYHSNPRHIPLLRHKVAAVLKKSRLSPKGHAAKQLMNIMETLPRDDLFQADPDELLSLSMGIMQLQERKKIRLFVRKDVYGRFVSCLVFVPRERFNTQLRQRIQQELMDAFEGQESFFSTRFSESVLARIHFIIRIDPKKTIEVEVEPLEKKLVEIARSWQDGLLDALLEHYGEELGNTLAQCYCDSFPAGYRDEFSPRLSVYDIEHMEELTAKKSLGMSVNQPLEANRGEFHFKIFHLNDPIPLSDVLPVLENMGLRAIGEHTYQVKPRGKANVWIHNFSMLYEQPAGLDVAKIDKLFRQSFSNIWRENAESDGFNRLVLAAQMTWHEVSMFRAYAKYLKQIGFTFSQTYVEQTLSSNADIAGHLLAIFKLRFDPALPRSETTEKKIEEHDKAIQDALEQVVSLDQDRILRRFLEMIYATLRTNFFQLTPEGVAKNYLSVKIDSSKVSEMPLPRPMFEIFVSSPRFDAIHLRSGKVARGGIRWSDRMEDFRTEILGLMKAQVVKNSVIVPAGAKGGFVCKSLPVSGTRDEVMAEVTGCYQNFIRGLLELTDNQKDDAIIPPPDVVRYDEDDPYLVVAADKGTATFSDVANAISEEFDFWLGDAFASGGSAGYDHKKMGITARGAWESVKRHFRELSIDTEKTDFTVIGIGDMAGDVFGNGMLLSEHIQLVSAFNHMHIFIDPNPDAKASFKERERLFNLPRSSWQDYDKSLISKGGGVFLRSAKAIKLSPEMKKCLGVSADVMVPNELIRVILKAEVDLLWNGGIGTFVKATTESHDDAGDRTNDLIRLNADELRCRVVGEGGNLGFTQLARVEYELAGGLVNTDFIDNSGGVDCSDQEVNIKILLNKVVRDGDMTRKQRDALLESMTDEVAQLVLKHNYVQSRSISLAAVQSYENLELNIRYIQSLEEAGLLNRDLEFLPDDKTLLARKGLNKGLTRPEIAVLLCYTKIIVNKEIVTSEAIDNPYLNNIIAVAFPKALFENYRDSMREHSLRREIVATQLSNLICNEMGITFFHRLKEETGATTQSIVAAYMLAREVYDARSVRGEIEDLGYSVPGYFQLEMMLEVNRLLRRLTRWFLRNHRQGFDIEDMVGQFKPGMDDLKASLEDCLLGTELELYEAAKQKLLDQKVPESLAKSIASTRILFSSLDIIDTANSYGISLASVIKVYFELGHRLNLGWVRTQIRLHPVDDHWDALARAAIRDDLDWQQRSVTIGVLTSYPESTPIDTAIEDWLKENEFLVSRWEYMLGELRRTPSLEFTMFAVAARELLDLAQTSVQCAVPLRVDASSKSPEERRLSGEGKH